MKQIQLTQGKVALVDDDVYEWAKDYKWFAHFDNGNWYACRGFTKGYKQYSMMKLHHAIIGFPLDGFEVDHIDGDGLNNQRSNLRFVDDRGNGQNQHLNNKTSKYVGVCWYKSRKKWRALIRINGKQKHLGFFNVEEEAAEVYRQAVNNLK